MGTRGMTGRHLDIWNAKQTHFIPYSRKFVEGANFRELLKNTIFAEKTSMDCSLLPCQMTPRPKFRRENFHYNREICESFLPRKLSAIR